MGFNQYTWKYYTGGESSIGRDVPYPFIYDGVEYDLNNPPYDLKINTPDTSNRIGSVYVSPIPATSIMLGYASYAARGYPLLIYNNSDTEYNIDKALISGRYIIPSSINTTYEYGSSTVIVNFTVDDVPKRYFVLCGGRDWAGKTTHTPTNYFTAGFGFEYPTLTSSNITKSSDYKLLNTSLSSAVVASEFVGKIIDFGTTGQIVPKWFKDWLDTAFTPIFPYTYIVKSADGSTELAKITEAPPMGSAKMEAAGNFKTLTLSGANRNYVLTWESEAPQGETFLGLAYGANSTRASIPVGQTTSVTWVDDYTLYEVYGTYRPPATTFDINLYQSSAEVNRVDKTDYLTGVGTLSGALREECSIIAPSITFKQTSVPTFNYVYIAAFGRYYFVTGITSVSKDIWRMSLSCDVLMTWKDDIRALTAIIARQENSFNPLLFDSELPAQANQNITVTQFPAGGFNTADAIEYPFVLTVVGA